MIRLIVSITCGIVVGPSKVQIFSLIVMVKVDDGVAVREIGVAVGNGEGFGGIRVAVGSGMGIGGIDVDLGRQLTVKNNIAANARTNFFILRSFFNVLAHELKNYQDFLPAWRNPNRAGR
jgi:hypothetical protein